MTSHLGSTRTVFLSFLGWKAEKILEGLLNNPLQGDCFPTIDLRHAYIRIPVWEVCVRSAFTWCRVEVCGPLHQECMWVMNVGWCVSPQRWNDCSQPSLHSFWVCGCVSSSLTRKTGCAQRQPVPVPLEGFHVLEVVSASLDRGLANSAPGPNVQ